jgi:uncharacterized protein (TIGR03066 family)
MLTQTLLLLAALSPAVEPDEKAKFVGTWATSVEMDGKAFEVVMEFREGGKLRWTVKANGKADVPAEGTYAVEKDKLLMDFMAGGKSRKLTATVKEMTGDSMLLLTYLSPTGSDEPVQLRFRKRK